jgi:type I restriction enzyme, S subunit
MSPDALAVVVPDEAAGASQRPGGLPLGWCLSTLAEVASINPATAFDGLANNAEIPFIPMTAVAEETGIIDASRRRSVAELRKGYVRFCEGDVIFAKITPCMENGKTAPVIGMPGGYAAGSTEFHVLRPGAVDPRYLWYWLVRHAFRHEAERNMSGSAGQLRVPVDYLRNSPISVAPLPEQRRIVARIDELFTEMSEGKAALERTRHGLDTWRRALLKAAVTGELTRGWREASRRAETGADLLARIRAEREACGSRSGRSRRVTTSSCLDAASLPQLPEGWVWTRLQDLIVSGPSNGYSPKKSKDGSGTLALKLTATTRGSIDLSDAAVKRLSEMIDKASDLFVRSGDLLFQRGNTIEYVGIAAVYEGPEETYVYPDLMIRVRTGNEILARWIWRVANSPLGRKYMREKATGTAGTMPKINGEILRNLPVPLPSFAEMVQALQLIDQRIDASDDLAKQAVASQKAINALRQSILKAAFEGRLVLQDPADEPASALLARLRNGHPGNGARRRRARATADCSHPSLPGLTPQCMDPRVEPAGDE